MTRAIALTRQLADRSADVARLAIVAACALALAAAGKALPL